VIAGFTRQTGLPEFIIADAMPLDLGAVQAHFADRIIGQPAAVDAMVDLIAMVKAGLSDPTKPLGVYLFIGPTGVGKTQLAKTLAAYLFGDEGRMLRFDMSEYSDPAAIRRLIGVPGAGRDGGEGELTRRVRAQPFCVILLDEFEKADPQIFDVLLQVLGEGRLTDAGGQTTSFQNAIVMMTSNLGAGAREQRSMGLSPERGRRNEPSEADESRETRPAPDYWQRRVEEHFRPEFVNRIDQVVVFQPLDQTAMRKIAGREIGDVLLRQGLVRRNVLVEIDPGVLDLLVEHGFTASYGARPLKRAIERLVVLPLARFLAARERPGTDLLRLRRAGDQITLQAASLSAGELVGGTSEPETSGTLDVGRIARRRLDDRALSEGFAELRRKLQDWDDRDAVIAMRDERATCLAETNKPTFWDDGDTARATLARFYMLDRLLKRLQQLADRAEYLEELSTLVHRQRDPRYRAELADGYERLQRDLSFLEVELLCAHLTDNHRAIVRVRRLGPPQREEGELWAAQLVAMYLRWAARKGYELDLALLEPIDESTKRGESLIAQHYPYRWHTLETSDIESTIRHVLSTPEALEYAIGMAGTNVFGFMQGEAGLHRRSDRRSSGERIQRLAEVLVNATGGKDPDIWLEKLLLQRAWEEQERAKLTTRQREKLPQPSEPEVVRVYQIEGERVVRDTRTQVRTTEVAAVLDGALDDFILAFLRDANNTLEG
jgi:energy-coupling factor transporter ATP-binding protein EcfA2